MPSNRRSFIAAILIMLSLGIIYLWGVFLIQLESQLGFGRSRLGLVSGLSLVFMTLAMMVGAALMRRIGQTACVIVLFALAGGGHLLFGLWPGPDTLLIGYGILFGSGTGLGYGLALSLAARSPERIRGAAISLVVTAFAASGVLFGLILPPLTSGLTVAQSFTAIGLALLVVGVVVSLLLAGEASGEGSGSGSAALTGTSTATRRADYFTSRFFLLLAIFFFVNFAGLMLMAHGAALLTSRGLGEGIAASALIALNLSYIPGSLAGGWLSQQFGARSTLLLLCGLVVAGMALLLGAGDRLAGLLAGIACGGFAFGAAASAVPTIVGRSWGDERISEIYGKLMFGYGLAGILAPWLGGALYSLRGDYTAALWLCGLAALVGMAAALPLRERPRLPGFRQG